MDKALTKLALSPDFGKMARSIKVWKNERYVLARLKLLEY